MSRHSQVGIGIASCPNPSRRRSANTDRISERPAGRIATPGMMPKDPIGTIENWGAQNSARLPVLAIEGERGESALHDIHWPRTSAQRRANLIARGKCRSAGFGLAGVRRGSRNLRWVAQLGGRCCTTASGVEAASVVYRSVLARLDYAVQLRRSWPLTWIEIIVRGSPQVRPGLRRGVLRQPSVHRPVSSLQRH